MANKILHLTLKKKWFDMIASGEKKEEYREVKDYWVKRLLNHFEFIEFPKGWEYVSREFDLVVFKNGYSTNAPTMTVECKGIVIGKAVSEWSDNWQGNVFKIKLGEIKEVLNG
jgi:hypothetical protein